MRTFWLWSLRSLTISACLWGALAQAQISFNTTYSAQTASNGSGCVSNGVPSYCTGSLYPLATNAGNTGAQTPFPIPIPGNISPLSVRSLMYSNFSGWMVAHYQGWFAPGHHIAVGYDETSSTVVHAQVNALQQFGWDTVEPDWYGQDYSGTKIENQNLTTLASDLQSRCSGSTCPMYYEVMYDYGTLDSNHTNVGQTISNGTQENTIIAVMKSDICYLNGSHFGNSSYRKWNGHPVLLNFQYELGNITGAAPSWQDEHYQIDNWLSGSWQTTCPAGQQANNGTPILVYENAGGFNQDSEPAGGAFAWPQPLTYSSSNQFLWNGSGGNYLDNFLSTGFNTYFSEFTMAGMWPGFDDSNASWGSNRVIARQCGQVWLNTFAKINAQFNSVHQIQAAGVATWNDMEEGTGIENGIDNCMSISGGTISGTVISWTATFSDLTYGTLSTVDHYRIFVSLDGTNYGVGADNISSSATSYDMSNANLPAGTYHVFVQAVGKPMIMNHSTNPVSFSYAGGAHGLMRVHPIEVF